MCLANLFTNIANAIREKTKTNELINATDFPTEIGKIKIEKVKLFNTIEEMNTSTDNKNEDLAIVYGLNKTSVKEDEYFQTLDLPENVVLDEALTSNTSAIFLDESGSLRVTLSLSGSTIQMITGSIFNMTVIANYTSNDGLTYTRTSTNETYTFNSPIKYSETNSSHKWDNVLEKILIVEKKIFKGLYEYNENEYVKIEETK